MKRYKATNVLSHALKLFVSLLIIATCACEKEENGNGITPAPPGDVRLKEIIHYENDAEFKKFEFSYTENNISKISEFRADRSNNITWDPSCELNIYYVGNRIESVLSEFYDNQWYLRNVKTEFFSGGGVYRTIYYNYDHDLETWNEEGKMEYSWTSYMEGWVLSGSIYYLQDNGNWINYLKNAYDYNGFSLSEADVSQWALTEWIPKHEYELSYSNNKLIEMLESFVNQPIEHKFTYHYNGELLSQIEKHKKDNETWILVENMNLTYDNNGNLVEFETTNHQNGKNDKYYYYYESGHHNLMLYIQSIYFVEQHYRLPIAVLFNEGGKY